VTTFPGAQKRALLYSASTGASQRQAALRLVASTSGRRDYIETIHQWRTRFAAASPSKTLLKLQLLPRWLTSADFRLAFTSGVSANSVRYGRDLLDHHRLVFEKAG
jgi:cyclopropane-fatty-acyl-phospholipid synthase